MSKAITRVAGAVAAASAALLSAGLAVAVDAEPHAFMMSPGKALELQIGDHHSISYFQPGSDACSLTVVMASSLAKAAEAEAHGTRIVVPVAPGRAMHIDGTDKQTAEFFCGPGGQKMTARIYNRKTYKGAKS